MFQTIATMLVQIVGFCFAVIIVVSLTFMILNSRLERVTRNGIRERADGLDRQAIRFLASAVVTEDEQGESLSQRQLHRLRRFLKDHEKMRSRKI
jgi:hypothetical protein